MFPASSFDHPDGYWAQLLGCPLLFPHRTDRTCDHEQFAKGVGCVKQFNLELGGRMRLELDRHSKTYLSLYHQSKRHSGSTVRRLHWVSSGPAAGFSIDRWTLASVQQMIAQDFGISYHRSHLSRLLDQFDWSLLQPLPRALEREEDVIRAWREHDWPRIKKARRRGVDIVFYDKFGWSFLERLRRTWAPRGKRPIVRRVTRDRRVLTTAAGLTLSGRIFKHHFVGGLKSQQVIEALEHTRRFLPEGFILVCDHAPITRAKRRSGICSNLWKSSWSRCPSMRLS